MLNVCVNGIKRCATVQTATSGVYQTIGNYLRENPDLLITSEYFKPIQFVTKRTAVYYVVFMRNRINWQYCFSHYFILQSRPYALYMIVHDVKSSAKCRMTVSTKPFGEVVQLGFAFPKDGPYNDILNDV